MQLMPSLQLLYPQPIEVAAVFDVGNPDLRKHRCLHQGHKRKKAAVVRSVQRFRILQHHQGCEIYEGAFHRNS